MVPLPLQTLSPRTGSKEGIVAAHIRVANSPGGSVGSWLGAPSWIGAPSRMALSPKRRRTHRITPTLGSCISTDPQGWWVRLETMKTTHILDVDYILTLPIKSALTLLSLGRMYKIG